MSLRNGWVSAQPGHGLRTLGDIIAVRGDANKAGELDSLARAKYRSLGMTRWAEGPRGGDEKSSDFVIVPGCRLGMLDEDRSPTSCLLTASDFRS
jgi:hypothetical protein